MSETTGDHKCEICGKSFPTRQGLGGHMKIHNRLDGDPTMKPAANAKAHARPPIKSRPKSKTRAARPHETPAPALSKVIPDIIDLQRELRARDDEIRLLKRDIEVQILRVSNLSATLRAAHTLVALGLNADVARPQAAN